jgi:hypothetical protein
VESYVRNYLVPLLGNISIKDIRGSHIDDFRRQLPRTLKPKTVENILSILPKILADASRRRDIERLPHFPTVEVDKTETKWLDEVDQERFLAGKFNSKYDGFVGSKPTPSASYKKKGLLALCEGSSSMGIYITL